MRLYLAFSRVSDPLWRQVHRKRLTQGKEVAERLPEKYGEYAGPPPEGPVLWFHALSVGEALAVVPLIEHALDAMPEAQAVLTTSTATSIPAIEKAGLPGRARHVLQPIDTVRAVRRFLDHWRPEVAVFDEIDFWPRLMVETRARGIPMVLVNSRLTQKNYDSRKRLGGMMGDVLRLFDAALVQDAETAGFFERLGGDPAKVQVLGVLKAAARPLNADPIVVEELRRAVAGRPVWLAAATHASEGSLVLEAHRRVLDALPDALMIVAPRILDGMDAYESEAKALFGKVSRRSRGDALTQDTQVYLADSIGEMGLWYRIAPVSFIGHSLDPEGLALRGKNPYEAAALGSAIVHGPMVSGQAQSYKLLSEAGATRQVQDAATLAETVVALRDQNERQGMTGAAMRVIEERRGVLDKTWDVIRACLKQ